MWGEREREPGTVLAGLTETEPLEENPGLSLELRAKRVLLDGGHLKPAGNRGRPN